MLTIYDAEKQDGLTDQMAKSVATVHAALRECDAAVVSSLESVCAGISCGSATETFEVQPDLAYIDSILVSTGWNKNDDVFKPDELFAARATPVNKPINLDHDSDVIIGHIVTSKAVDKEGVEVTEDNVPDEFDLEVAGVLYKRLKPELVKEIVDGAKDGTKFVSMECWFDDFGYAIMDPSTGEEKIVTRTKDTAFLTKHLRIYGGTGSYRGMKIGRQLRAIRFAGKGIVSNPANPESVIKEVARVAASVIENQSEGGANEMAKETETTTAPAAESQKAEAELNAKVAEIASINEAKAAVEKKLTDLQASYDAQAEVVKTTASELVAAKEAMESQKKDAEAKIADLTKRAETAEAKLADIELDKLAQSRLTQLKAVKTVDDENATLAELKAMSEEVFKTVLKYAGGTKASETQPATTTEASAEAGKSEAAADAALDNVETETETIQPGTQDGETKMDTAKAVASFLLPTAK